VLWGGVAGAALTAAVFASAVTWMWPVPAIAEYRPLTFRRGVVSSARFTPDGNFVYSASWEGRPYAAFLGRPEGPDARDLQLEDARILSISKHTAPYFHDNSSKTLDEVAEQYRIFFETEAGIHLTPQDEADMVAFLKLM
jgi:hypothetical protein